MFQRRKSMQAKGFYSENSITVGKFIDVIGREKDKKIYVSGSEGAIITILNKENYPEGWHNAGKILEIDYKEYEDYCKDEGISFDLLAKCETVEELLQAIQKYKDYDLNICGDIGIVVFIYDDKIAIDYYACEEVEENIEEMKLQQI